MLKAKIKISQITNLTDARYFAAWGVDFLGFDINPESEHFSSPSIVAEISEWVEGPERPWRADLVNVPVMMLNNILSRLLASLSS